MAKKAFGKKEFNYSEVSRELKKDGPQRLYLLHGQEDYLLARFVEELTRACLPDGADDFSFRELDGASLNMQELSDSVNALPFASERTLTIVRGYDINHCKEGDQKALERIVSDIPDFATLVFINRGASEPDGRLKAVKLLQVRQGYRLRRAERQRAEQLDTPPLRRAGQENRARRMRRARLRQRQPDGCAGA